MNAFLRRRRWARLCASVGVLGLAVLIIDQESPRETIYIAVTVTSVLMLRGFWRCPECGIPPSWWPWIHGSQCRVCDADWQSADSQDS